MKGRTLGVWHTLNGLPAAQLGDLARRVENLGYTALWYPEAIGYEAFSLGGHLLSQTTAIKIGSGIANIYARDPLSAAQAHDTLNAIYGGRFVMGLGVSHAPAVEGVRGHAYGKPVATMRAYLEAMARAELMTPDVEPQIVIAALGPRMLALSAELTQGALPYSVTPEHTASARGILGPDPWLCVQQKVCLETDPDTARKAASRALGRHLQLPNYRNSWLRQGFSEDDFVDGGSERFLDAIVSWGPADTIKDHVQAHFDSGADHVCIEPVNPRDAVEPDWDAMEALAPAG